MKFFDKYYAVLGLPPNSGDTEIKAAYRKLVKVYHPDRSGDDRTREKFIEVSEAYEILINRQQYIQDAVRRYYQKKANTPGPPTRQEVRERAATHADMQYEKFTRSPLYRTAMVMNFAADYVFLVIGIFMILSPVFAYFSDMDRAALRGEEPDFNVVPALFGIAFLYGMWYFIFRKNK